jgi:RNA polymerase sigma-70 factor (ECF subfamily)
MDLVHEAWVVVLRRHPWADRFASVDALAGYLTRVAHGKTVDVVRQRLVGQKRAAHREQAGGDLEHLTAATADTPSTQAIANELWEQMLAKLPPVHRRAAELLRDGHNREIVARFTGLSVSTVDRIVRRLKDVCGW